MGQTKDIGKATGKATLLQGYSLHHSTITGPEPCVDPLLNREKDLGHVPQEKERERTTETHAPEMKCS